MSPPCSSSNPWYALRVKHHHEKIVAQALEGRGIEYYLPLYRSLHRSARRMEAVMLPLLPGFVFCRLDLSNRLPVLTIPGVGGIVCIGRTPAPIPESELANIETLIQSDLGVAPHEALYRGQEVRINRGPLQGMCGILVDTKPNYRLVVSISLLQRAVSAEVNLEWVTPVNATVRAA